MSARDRQIAEEDAKLVHHLTLESQREFLMRRGFSPSHPYITGEVPIHPELQGRLPFHVPSRYVDISWVNLYGKSGRIRQFFF